MLHLILARLMRHVMQAQLTFAMMVTAVGRSYGEITAITVIALLLLAVPTCLHMPLDTSNAQ